MNNQLININGIDYFLKFGYGAFRVLGQIWKVGTLEATGEKISKAFQNLDHKNGTFGFEQMDVLCDMVYSAILCKNPQVKNDINKDDIATEILKNPNALTEIIELYMSSISSILSPAGKPKPAIKKRQKVKK
tara:strand:+ start:7926 stop:8321 length:396 start_codon:yes stop_codon:yes gene_type:complete